MPLLLTEMAEYNRDLDEAGDRILKVCEDTIQLLDIVKAAQQACYDFGALEVITNIKIHSRTPEATDTFCTYHRGVTSANHMFVEE